MPIDASKVQWDSPQIDPSAVQWDDAPKKGADKFGKTPDDYVNERAANARDGAAGVVRSLAGIGNTVLAPVRWAADAAGGSEYLNSVKPALRRMDDGHAQSQTYGRNKVATDILATAPVGGILGKGANALGFTRLGSAIGSGGMTTGAAPVNALGRAADMGTRMLGGAINGGATAGLIDPEQAGLGATVGGVLPPAIAGAGALGNAIGRKVAGPPVPENLLASVKAAREVGYVIPPSQAKPTLANRLMEGFAGKLTTAQNASAKNQQVTNALAKKAIGAEDLTPEALQAVRTKANQAYDQLASVGAFQADDAYRAAIQQAAGSKALPGIANKEVDDLVGALAGQNTLDAQQAIESIKRLRFEGAGNKSAQDPVKRALGSSQMKIAKALEDLIDRNLETTGQQGLLEGYRAARQTLAKVYDVEKAMNPASGNIDASKLAALLKKGRPLSGDLKTAAEFAGQFPKAAQSVDRMGSLPQVSPLDWTAAGMTGLATGNPLMLGGVAARPAARALALSPMVQNRLATPARESLNLLNDPSLALLYRSAPVLAADR
jgi:hypothetical protein